MALAGCTVPAQPGPRDSVGTWQMQSRGGDTAAEFSIFADQTYTAREIPATLACSTEVTTYSPPGCGDDRSTVDFSGHWESPETNSLELRLYFAGRFVRAGYRDGDDLGFSTHTLEAPRPDYVFARKSSK
jgi:hypothetical protein